MKSADNLKKEIEGIKKLLHYIDVDIETGICTWKRPRKSINVGDVAGCKKEKYHVICFDYMLYRRHRIVFYFAKGYLPQVVDHIHGVEHGDGIDNLQEASQRQNVIKKKGQKNNKSGYRGVCWSSRAEKYRATIGIDGKQIHLGYFDTPEEASKAYHQKAKETFGDFYNPLVK